MCMTKTCFYKAISKMGKKSLLIFARLLAASVEVCANDKALRWPEAIAPYRILIIGPKEGSKEWATHGWDSVLSLGERLSKISPGSVLLDDRHTHSIGRRMKAADRLGFPAVVVCGKSACQQPPLYELHVCRKNGYSSPLLLTSDELVAELSSSQGINGEEMNNNKIQASSL